MNRSNQKYSQPPDKNQKSINVYFKEIYEEAYAAGLLKASILAVDGSRSFAWIWLPENDTNREFLAWLQSEGIGHRWFPSGWIVWLTEFENSKAKKEALGKRMTEILSLHGIEGHCGSAALEQDHLIH